MNKIGLFFGSDTGNTEVIAGMIQNKIGNEKVDLFDVFDVSMDKISEYTNIIIGLSTWHDGQLVSSFDDGIEEFKEIDFAGKKIALFGLGDQFGYSEYFIDAVGTIGKLIISQGGTVVVNWPTDDYDFENSNADLGNGYFMGLALDEDNQDDFTEERLDLWIPQILEAFNL